MQYSVYSAPSSKTVGLIATSFTMGVWSNPLRDLGQPRTWSPESLGCLHVP